MYFLSMYCGGWSTLVSCYSNVRIQCTFYLCIVVVGRPLWVVTLTFAFNVLFIYVLWSLVDPCELLFWRSYSMYFYLCIVVVGRPFLCIVIVGRPFLCIVVVGRPLWVVTLTFTFSVLLSMYCGRWSTLVSCYSNVRIQCTFIYVLWWLVDPCELLL